MIEYLIDTEFVEARFIKKTKCFVVVFPDPKTCFIPTTATIKDDGVERGFFWLKQVKWNEIRHQWEATYAPF